MNTTSASVALAVVCVDWRMHHPDSNFMKGLYNYTRADKVYIVTYPGPDGICDGMVSETMRGSLETVIRQTRTVLNEHGAEHVKKYIVSHAECAGHSANDQQHGKDAVRAATLISDELELTVPFIPLLAKKGNDDFTWKIETV